MSRSLPHVIADPLAIVAALAICASRMEAQNGAWPPFSEPFRWSDWEMPGPRPDSAALDRLGICPHVAAQAASFHWMDADGDGLADLVFSGPVAWCTPDPEGTSTAVYLNRGGVLVLALQAEGAVAAVWRALPAHPVSLLLGHSHGEGLSESRYAWYTPHFDGDSLVFRRAGELAAAPGTRTPEGMLAHPRPFIVPPGAGPSPVRLTPDAADSMNVIVTFAGGSRGVALAEWTDAAGREWWFVRMHPSGHATADADDPYHLRGAGILGWMPARSLTPLRDTRPRGPVNTLAPFGRAP
ncbi:MAG TPA: hypothetical protein VHG08_23915 [Longimicrobium sp.]|nr:hypothetical protein [Longimicrobium sp.]